jgi:hypothetical protein
LQTAEIPTPNKLRSLSSSSLIYHCTFKHAHLREASQPRAIQAILKLKG